MPDDGVMTPASVAEPWWRPFRKSGHVLVTHVDLTPCADREKYAVAWLHRQERARCRGYLHSRPRRQFALCRAALRAILCGELGCGNEALSFGSLSHGKPYALVGGVRAPISFNVSHGGRHGLIALAAAGRVGVDVEERKARRDLDGIAETVFTPAEQADLALAAGDQKIHLFFRLWTMKEALIKALGTGFSLDPSRFEIPPDLRRSASAGVFRFPQNPETGWWLENLGNGEFAAAVACELGPQPQGGETDTT